MLVQVKPSGQTTGSGKLQALLFQAQLGQMQSVGSGSGGVGLHAAMTVPSHGTSVQRFEMTQVSGLLQTMSPA